jgi:tetratricopeptide (TPR) repeat protein
LEIDPNSPLLWCILGDLTNDTTMYEKAWSVSSQRYSRAMRSLGAHHYKTGDFQSCIECYQKALAMNALFENAWFTLGCAAMQVEDWEEARSAFMRCVNLENGNGEAWNNLAAINIRLERKYASCILYFILQQDSLSLCFYLYFFYDFNSWFEW